MQLLLSSLCAGIEADELPAAISGLLGASASVRAAALAALPSVPLLAAGECPADAAVAAVLWLARFDASPGEGQTRLATAAAHAVQTHIKHGTGFVQQNRTCCYASALICFACCACSQCGGGPGAVGGCGRCTARRLRRGAHPVPGPPTRGCAVRGGGWPGRRSGGVMHVHRHTPVLVCTCVCWKQRCRQRPQGCVEAAGASQQRWQRP